jgi:ribosomal protein S18 acetylase RimI-like enzyme
MDPAVRVRRGSVDDIPAITRHRLGMMREMRLATPAECAAYDPEFRLFAQREISAGNFISFLAETEAGQVVAGGAVYIVPWPGNPSNRLQKRAFLLNVVTEPEFRRRGIARAVVGAMLDWCRAQGFHSVRLLASEAGRPLYQSFGFYPTNEMKLDF